MNKKKSEKSTEKLKNELARLKTSESLYKHMVHGSNVLIVRMRTNGKILFINDFGLKFLGYSKEEILNKNIIGTILSNTKVSKQTLDKMMKNLEKNPEISQFIESEYLQKNGMTALIAWTYSAVFDKDGNLQEVLSTGIDISRLKQAEDLLRKERNLISAILETTGALVVLFDTRGRFIRINQAFEDLTGFTIIDLVGKPIWDTILLPKETKAFKAMFEKVKTSDYPIEHKGMVATKDGKNRSIIWSYTGLKQQDKDQVEFIVGSGVDVTELQEALGKIKTLQGLLPICASCKKIRDDKGYWNQIEEYIRKHSDATFSHSVCPDCAKKFFSDFYEDSKDKIE